VWPAFGQAFLLARLGAKSPKMQRRWGVVVAVVVVVVVVVEGGKEEGQANSVTCPIVE
jgi:hypothetical protein